MLQCKDYSFLFNKRTSSKKCLLLIFNSISHLYREDDVRFKAEKKAKAAALISKKEKAIKVATEDSASKSLASETESIDASMEMSVISGTIDSYDGDETEEDYEVEPVKKEQKKKRSKKKK